MAIQGEPEKCRGPLSMAFPSCRVNYGGDNVGSMNGIEMATSRSIGMEVKIINPTAKG